MPPLLIRLILLGAFLLIDPVSAQDWPDGVPHQPGVHPAEAAAARAAANASGKYDGRDRQVVSTRGFTFFYPYLAGPAAGGYLTPFGSQSYPVTPITTCGTGDCGYHPVPQYGYCYTLANGEAWHSLVSWSCFRYDNTLVTSSYCQPPPAQAPCR